MGERFKWRNHHGGEIVCEEVIIGVQICSGGDQYGGGDLKWRDHQGVEISCGEINMGDMGERILVYISHHVIYF